MRRVARAGLSDLPNPLSNSTSSSCSSSSIVPSKRGLCASLSSTACVTNLPLSDKVHGFSPNWPVSPSSSSSLFDDYELVRSVEDDVLFDDFGFGPAPSYHEAETALFVLNQGLGPISYLDSNGDRTPNLGADSPNQLLNYGVLMKKIGSESSDLDWKEPSLQIYDQRMIQPHGLDRVYDAFHMLQTDPHVQRMVISLSTDKAVWDAILKNEAVQELRESYNQDPSPRLSKNSDPPASSSVLNWIFKNMRAKLMELIANVTNLMSSLFHPQDQEGSEKCPDGLGEKVTAIFMLTTVVLLIVMVTRDHHA